ncbi:MAG: hypothetical protein ACI9MR_001481 [Myxococcota bacterium]|jgi:hypothetical protein
MTRTLLTGMFTTLALAGCPDTQGGLDDFQDRTETLRMEVVQTDCMGIGDIDDEFFVAVAVVISPDPPILLQGTFTTDTTATPPTISAALTILNKETRAKLDGALITATAELEADGSYELDFGDITVPAEGNPITGTGIPAVFLMSGCSSEPQPCGTVDGTAAGALALEGSTWNSVTLTGGEDLTQLEAVSACPEPAN